MLQRNFTTFVVGDGARRATRRVTVDGRRAARAARRRRAPAAGQWSVRRWDAMDGRKQNGAGSGCFEYRLAWPKDLAAAAVAGATFVAELGAKQLFGKDRPQGAVEGDFMRGEGTHDPGRNPNAYPMTDAQTHPSAVRVRVNGATAGVFELPDDPADHRGVAVVARAEARREKPTLERGRLVRLPRERHDPAAALPRRRARARSCCGSRWTRRCPAGSPSTAGSGRYALDPTVVLTLR